jgi:hypothetical protein
VAEKEKKLVKKKRKKVNAGRDSCGKALNI